MPKEILIRDIRSKHIGKEIIIKGLVKQESDIRPQVISSKFECSKCKYILSVLQIEHIFRSPNKCKCGFNGPFKLLSKEIIDVKNIVLEEDIKSDNPKKIKAILKKELTSPENDRLTSIGNFIEVSGILEEESCLTDNQISNNLELVLEVNNLKVFSN
jgi:DNA replicative helicase MCM subunit Mcm2 (Cdc46/Mcm family)